MKSKKSDVKHYPLCVLMQFEEQKEQVVVEQVLRVVFLDPERPTLVSWMQISPICISLHFVYFLFLPCPNLASVMNIVTLNLIYV